MVHSLGCLPKFGVGCCNLGYAAHHFFGLCISAGEREADDLFEDVLCGARNRSRTLSAPAATRTARVPAP
jgi:hypothetical protein